MCVIKGTQKMAIVLTFNAIANGRVRIVQFGIDIGHGVCD